MPSSTILKKVVKGGCWDIFEKNGLQNKSNQRFQFWQHENHPILLDNDETRFVQRLQYLHENPVRAGFVAFPQEWKYSSAIDFYTTSKGLLDLVGQKI